jgi:2-polyprenyl-6-methoxyphenol hydroxylase-like FAD-dependent oxidoreductase
MTPFAGVGVNVAMEDALELAKAIIARKSNWEASTFHDSISLSAAVKEYEIEVFVRAEKYAKETWMYLGLFFHERGGVAMVEHFEKVRAQEKANAEIRAVA